MGVLSSATTVILEGKESKWLNYEKHSNNRARTFLGCYTAESRPGLVAHSSNLSMQGDESGDCHNLNPA